MILEATHLQGVGVHSAAGVPIGTVDICVINGKYPKVVGFQLVKNGVIKKFYGVKYEDIETLSRERIIVRDEKAVLKDLKDFDEIYKTYGRVIGVGARTESGRKIGKVADLLIEVESGYVVRFYLRNLLKERIIPRQFLVSITPKEIIFKDVVEEPIFDKVATEVSLQPALSV